MPSCPKCGSYVDETWSCELCEWNALYQRIAALEAALRRVVEAHQLCPHSIAHLSDCRCESPPAQFAELDAAIDEAAKLVKDDPTKGESHEHDTA